MLKLHNECECTFEPGTICPACRVFDVADLDYHLLTEGHTVASLREEMARIDALNEREATALLPLRGHRWVVTYLGERETARARFEEDVI